MFNNLSKRTKWVLIIVLIVILLIASWITYRWYKGEKIEPFSLEVDKFGNRVQNYRPYINEEELWLQVVPDDPNGPVRESGLYKGPQPMCGCWKNEFNKMKRKPKPMNVYSCCESPTTRSYHCKS